MGTLLSHACRTCVLWMSDRLQFQYTFTQPLGSVCQCEVGNAMYNYCTGNRQPARHMRFMGQIPQQPFPKLLSHFLFTPSLSPLTPFTSVFTQLSTCRHFARRDPAVMRKTRLVWGQDAVQIGDMLCNSETELLQRTEGIEKNFQIKIRCFRCLC